MHVIIVNCEALLKLFGHSDQSNKMEGGGSLLEVDQPSLLASAALRNLGFKDKGCVDEGFEDEGFEDEGYANEGFEDRGFFSAATSQFHICAHKPGFS